MKKLPKEMAIFVAMAVAAVVAMILFTLKQEGLL